MPRREPDVLLTATDIRKLAAAYDVVPTKNLGQNFVIDGNTIRKIVALANIGSHETVLEVGPGLGSLTFGLLAVSGRVVACEIDRNLGSNLVRTVEAYAPDYVDKLVVLIADILQTRIVPDNCQQPTVLVANLPYNIAVPIVLHILEFFPNIERVVVMVQLEVARRLCATPGNKDYGVPSAKLAWYGRAKFAGTIGKNVFWPAPRIDSGLVVFDRRSPLGSVEQQKDVFAAIDAAFSQRRKTLRTALASWAGGVENSEQILRHANIDSKLRGETLGIEDFILIAQSAQSCKDNSFYEQ